MKNRFRKLFRGMRRTPLVLLVVISAALFVALMIPGIGKIYDISDWNPVEEPLLLTGMERIHDGVWPWQVYAEETGHDGNGEAGEAEYGDGAGPAGSVTTDGGEDGVGEDEKAGFSGSDGSSGSAGQGDDAAGSSDGEAPGAAGSAATEDGVSAVAETVMTEDGEQGNTAGSAVEDGGQAGSAGSAATEDGDAAAAALQKAKESNPTYIHADHMPAEVNDKVVEAKDYGLADKHYLSPDDTVYNTDTEGTFAQNGDYYLFTDVDDSYLADALIIGDSRTEGLHGFTSMQKSTYFASKEGLSVYNFWDKEVNYYEPGKDAAKKSMDEVLAGRTFGKIYISLGINELGIGTTKKYYDNYREILAKIREAQPDAVIFIEGMMHVSEKLSSTSNVFSNTIVVQRNTAVATLANGHDIFYIDMNSVLCDADGNLQADMTGDGIHLYASEYEKWHAFLLTRGIQTTSGAANNGAADGSAAVGGTAGDGVTEDSAAQG
ncbi:MAG: GDSL-type esterase/lipase family protein [Lachnospiraceae bacterium]|nr:GDSL-type esterase/lipase family protein [Lachnospiraceae bacterium]